MAESCFLSARFDIVSRRQNVNQSARCTANYALLLHHVAGRDIARRDGTSQLVCTTRCKGLNSPGASATLSRCQPANLNPGVWMAAAWTVSDKVLTWNIYLSIYLRTYVPNVPLPIYTHIHTYTHTPFPTRRLRHHSHSLASVLNAAFSALPIRSISST